MDDADQIWNRATRGGGSKPRPDDAALSAVLVFHGLAMNGGVLHAFEALDAEELGRARDGFAWLELNDVAQLLEATAQSIANTDWDDTEAVDALEAGSDDAYDAVLPNDETLEEAFRRRLPNNLTRSATSDRRMDNSGTSGRSPGAPVAEAPAQVSPCSALQQLGGGLAELTVVGETLERLPRTRCAGRGWSRASSSAARV